LYVVGGFGGASGAIFDTISGGPRSGDLRKAWDKHCDSLDTQVMHKNYCILGQQLEPNLTIDYDAVLGNFSDLTLTGLSQTNGLTEEDNGRLANSRDMHEILALLVKGLSKLKQMRSPVPQIRRS
jgi:hypothetical protein